MKELYKTIDGWFNWQKLYSNMVDKYSDGAKFVEIGAWLGCSTCYMCEYIKDSDKKINFYAVDTWKGTVGDDFHTNFVKANNGDIYDLFVRNLTERDNVIQYVNPLRMTSVEASTKFRNEELDFIFIDAAHDYENVKLDLISWYPKLKKNGIIGGHDFGWPGVNSAVNEFFTNFPNRLVAEYIPKSEIWVAIII